MLPQEQNDSYFRIPAISNSFLGERKRELLGQPGLNRHSPALRNGSIFHKIALEPETFNFRDYSGRERMQALRLKNSIDTNVPAEFLQGEKEKALFYEYMGWRCKLKVDIVSRENRVVTDLKTTAYKTEAEFIGSIIEYDYWRQGAWYLDCPKIRNWGIDIFRIIAICKVDPYPVFFFTVHRDDPRLGHGREDYKSILSYMEGDPRYAERRWQPGDEQYVKEEYIDAHAANDAALQNIFSLTQSKQ